MHTGTDILRSFSLHLRVKNEWKINISWCTHFSLELPVVVDESAEFRCEFHLFVKVVRGGVLVEGLLHLYELGGSVGHVILVGGGEEMVPRGRASKGSVLQTVGLCVSCQVT